VVLTPDIPPLHMVRKSPGGHSAIVAVENDYDLLVDNLGRFAENVAALHAEVRRRLFEERRRGLDPNAKTWVNLLVQRMPVISGPASKLEADAWQVLQSHPGEAVFEAQPPEAPDAIP
jgi:hypothetical protein